ncbi:MAG: PEGA domain-containing protein [Phycisphaerales bacterium JB063]
MARHTTPAGIATLALAALLSTGCVQRVLSIQSDPPGALVYLNDQEVGRTPVTVPFTWYGTYDVRLEMAGYQTLHTEQRLDQPWWEHPGPDLFAEAIPGKRVERSWSFELEPALAAEAVDTDTLLDHARQLRELNDRPVE